MKRRGRLLKTRPRRPGVYSNPPFIWGPAFIYQIHFLVLEVYLTKNQISTKERNLVEIKLYSEH